MLVLPCNPYFCHRLCQAFCLSLLFFPDEAESAKRRENQKLPKFFKWVHRPWENCSTCENKAQIHNHRLRLSFCYYDSEFHKQNSINKRVFLPPANLIVGKKFFCLSDPIIGTARAGGNSRTCTCFMGIGWWNWMASKILASGTSGVIQAVSSGVNQDFWPLLAVCLIVFLFELCPRTFIIGLASDEVKKLSNAWQRGKLVLNKDSAPHKSMLGKKSLTGRSSLFLRGEVWTVLTTSSQLSVSHSKRYRGSDKCGAVFRSIDNLQACFCMGRYLSLEPNLPVAVLWRSTCKPSGAQKKQSLQDQRLWFWSAFCRFPVTKLNRWHV